jgi:hypothetical protein
MVAKPLTVKEAREVAENAARVALEQLGVGATAPLTIDVRTRKLYDPSYGSMVGSGEMGERAQPKPRGSIVSRQRRRFFYWVPLKKARDARRW